MWLYDFHMGIGSIIYLQFRVSGLSGSVSPLGIFPLTLKPSGKSLDEDRRQQLQQRKKQFVAKRQMMPLSPGDSTQMPKR